MNIKKNVLGMAIAVFVILACRGIAPTAVAPDVNAIVTQTLQALTAEPTNSQAEPQQLTPDGTPVETAEISFFIPNGVANDAVSVLNTNVEYPYINPSAGDMPLHPTIRLDLYALNATIFDPHIMIFRTSEYSQYSELTAGIISSLQSLQYTDGQPLDPNLDGPTYTAQIHAINFKNGHGIRYLTQVGQAPAPANNEEMFYYFQGLTSDGQYYVQAVLPINAPYLPANGNPNTPLPADGIPFNLDDIPGYFTAITQKLNTTETFGFNPYLDALDEMIESIQVKGF